MKTFKTPEFQTCSKCGYDEAFPCPEHKGMIWCDNCGDIKEDNKK